MNFRWISKIGLVCIATTSNAQVFSGAYPYIAPENCQIQVDHPDNATGVYMDKNCTTAFVLPPRIGQVVISGFSPTENMRECGLYNETRDMIESAYKDIVDLRKKISQLDPNDSRVVGLMAQIQDSQELITFLRNELNYYKSQVGASAQVLFDMQFGQPHIDQYVLKNKNLLLDKDIRFTMAPIGESVISFTAVDGKQTINDPIIAATIPGVAINGDETVPGQVIMNGAISGRISLNLQGACPFVSHLDKDELRRINLRKIRPSEKELAAHLVANVTYSVPMQTATGYEASLEIQQAVSSLTKRFKEKSRFTLTEMTDIILQGSGSTAFHFNYEAFEPPANADMTESDTTLLKDRLRSEVADRLTNHLVKQLADLNYLKNTNEPEEIPYAEPGTVQHERWRRVCRTQKFLFIKKQKCWDESYLVPEYKNGIAQQMYESLNQTQFSAKESVRVNDIIYRTHTATFKTP